MFPGINTFTFGMICLSFCSIYFVILVSRTRAHELNEMHQMFSQMESREPTHVREVVPLCCPTFTWLIES